MGGGGTTVVASALIAVADVVVMGRSNTGHHDLHLSKQSSLALSNGSLACINDIICSVNYRSISIRRHNFSAAAWRRR